MRHQIRIVGIFGGSNQGRENRYGDEAEQQRKPDNGRRIAKNPAEGKFELAQSGMGLGCGQLRALFVCLASI